MLGIYFALLAALGGYYRWDRLGVPGVDTKSFGDMRSITSAWECVRRGIAVIYLNPCDPLKRPANYPRIWLAPASLGLGQGSTPVLGILVAIAFLVAAVAVLPQQAGFLAGVVYGIVLCSPSVMLGVQRGNVDVLLFAVVSSAALLFRTNRGRSVFSSGLVLLAAALKLFPIFAIGLLARQRRRTALIECGSVILIFVLYAIVIRGDIRAIRAAAPQQDGRSYGINIVGSWISSTSGLLTGNAWDGVLAAALIALALLIANRTALVPRLSLLDEDRDLRLFWAGSAVYLFTYLLFRSWDYRLAFLLMTAPGLFLFARQRSPMAIATLAAALTATWFGTATWTQQPWRIVPNDIAQLVLFVGLLATLIVTAREASQTARGDRRIASDRENPVAV